MSEMFVIYLIQLQFENNNFMPNGDKLRMVMFKYEYILILLYKATH